jgi:hypothetical protein
MRGILPTRSLCALITYCLITGAAFTFIPWIRIHGDTDTEIGVCVWTVSLHCIQRRAGESQNKDKMRLRWRFRSRQEGRRHGTISTLCTAETRHHEPTGPNRAQACAHGFLRHSPEKFNSYSAGQEILRFYEAKRYRTESITKQTTIINNRWEAIQMVMAAKLKLTRLSHKIAIQVHIVAESCTICRSRSRRSCGNFWIHPRTLKYSQTPPSPPILNHFNPVYPFKLYFPKIHFNIIFSSTYRSPEQSLLWRLPTKLLYVFLVSRHLIFRPYHPPWLQHPKKNPRWREQLMDLVKYQHKEVHIRVPKD